MSLRKAAAGVDRLATDQHRIISLEARCGDAPLQRRFGPPELPPTKRTDGLT
jgi:hypothetical protein